MPDKTTVNVEESLHLLCMLWAEEAVITYKDNSYFITLKNINRKVQYSTSRPKKVRGFIEAKKVMSIWMNNNKIFDEEPPEIAFTFSERQSDENGIHMQFQLI